MQNPWMGPSSYEEPKASDKQEYKFCGRDNATWELTSLINDNLYVTLYGRSGIGKTSLLKAGVFPKLREMGYLPVVIRLSQMPDVFSGKPAAYLVYQIQKELAEDAKKITPEDILDMCDWTDEDVLWTFFATHQFEKAGQPVYPAIVLDQFEEIFNARKTATHAEEGDTVDLLMKQLYSLTDDNKSYPEGYHEANNFRLIFSIREDYLYTLEDCIDKNFLTKYKYNRYRLKAPTYEEAAEIITEPGRELLPENEYEKKKIVEKIIANATFKDDGNISPFMLSLICSELFKKVLQAHEEAPKIDSQMIPEDGENILRDFYLGVVKDLLQEEREHLEDDLVDSNRMRNSVNIGMMDQRCPSWRSLMEGNNRILQEVNGKVELVHDMLAGAIFDVREKRKEELRLAALEQEKEKIRRRNRRRILFISGLFVLSLLVIGVSFEIIREMQQREWKIKTNQYRAIAGKAMDLAKEGDSFTGRMLASEILNNHYENGDPFCPEAEHALRYFDALQSHIMKGHSNKVTSAAINTNGKIIASSSWDGTILLWNVYDGRIFRTLNANKGKAFCVSFSPDGKHLACGYYDGTIRIWNYEDGTIDRDIEGHVLGVKSISYSKSGKLLVSTALFDETAVIWNPETGSKIHQLPNNKSVIDASFSPDETKVATASVDGIIRLWDLETWKETKIIKGHEGYINAVSFSPDGKKLLSAGEDRTIRLWDVDAGSEILKILAHTRMINSASFSSDGMKIVSSSNDNTIKIFDVKGGFELNRFVGHKDFVQTACFILNDKNILSSSYDGTVRIWDMNDIREFNTLKGGNYSFHYASFSPNGNYVVSAGEDSMVRIWDIKLNKEVRSMRGHDSRVYCANFSPDGTKIVSASYDNTIIVWDSKTGKLIHRMEGHSKPVTKSFYSPNGRLLASSSWDGTIKIWDAGNYKELRTIPAHKGYVLSISYSPNGKYIASCSSDSTARIWDVATGRQSLQLNGHEGTVISISYDPTGNYIVTSSADKTFRIWDANTGREIIKGTLSNGIYFASYSPDGKYIVTASYDGTILVHDATTGLEIENLRWETTGYGHNAYTSYFSPDGKKIAVACSDNAIRLWDFLPLQQLINETRERFKNHPLTPEDRHKYYLE